MRDAADIAEGHARRIRYPDPRGGETLELVLCRFEGELFALDSLCPHEGGRLAAGRLLEGRYAYCPLHLFKYDPRTGRTIDVDSPAVPTYAVRERDGHVEIRVHGPDAD